MNVVAMRPKPDAGSFDEFWQLYPHPRRVGKVLARAKWEAITGPGLHTQILDKSSGQYVRVFLQATPEEIIAGLTKYERSCRKPGVGEYGYKDDGQFICHPTSWLNQGRWLDD